MSEIKYTPTKKIKDDNNTVRILSRGDEIYIHDIPENQLFNCRLSAENIYHRKLFITKSHIIQLVLSVSKKDTYIVLAINNLSTLTKVKFKRGDGKLSILFNNNEQIQYYLENVISCISFIQKVMLTINIEGIPSNKIQSDVKYSKKIETAEKMFDATTKLVQEFNDKPNIDIILHVMDLLRESAERFSEANNNKYKEVIDFIKNFLMKNEVIQLLDIESKNRKTKSEVKKVTEIKLVDNNNNNSNNGDNNGNNNNGNNNNNNDNDNNNSIDNECNPLNTNSTIKIRKINLEDVDTSSMERLLSKPIPDDEIDDDVYKIRHRASTDSVETNELNNMLGDMTYEFNALLSTFSTNPSVLSHDDTFDEGVETFDLHELDLLINDNDSSMSNSFVFNS